MLQQTNWTEMVAPFPPISEFRFIQGALNYRPRTRNQINRKARSISSGIIPAVIKVAYTTKFNHKGDSNPHYVLLDNVDLWNQAIAAGFDPRQVFHIYVMPACEEDLLVDNVADIHIRLNRVVKKLNNVELANTLAPSYPEYDRIAQLHQTYPDVSISEILVALNPGVPIRQLQDAFESRTFVATNTVHGLRTLELMNAIHAFLEEDSRWDITSRSTAFIREAALRMQANPGITFVFTPPVGRGRITGTIPGNTLGNAFVNPRGVVQFRSIAQNVLRSDVDFPKRAYPIGNRRAQAAWIDRILKAIGL